MPAKYKYAREGAQFFQGLSTKFGSGKGAAVDQLLRNIGLLFSESDPRHAPLIPIDGIKEVFPVAVVHEPLLCSGFASHALATEFAEGLSRLKLVAGIQIHPLQVVAIEDLERIEPYLTDREFTLADCFRAKIYEDPKHQWTLWDFLRLRYLPSRGIAPRGNARLDAIFDWLMMAAMWRVYRGEYRDPSFGKIAPSERACVCVRPLDGDDLLFDEWKVLSEHESVAEAYRAYDELCRDGCPAQQIKARTFDLLVTDRFGIEIHRPN